MGEEPKKTFLMIRFLLLALLPILAVLLYMEGQQYDPALINFQASADASAEHFFPGAVDGLNRSGPLRIYTKENLYEYVDGHAEYFISAGFESLSVGEYLLSGSNPDRPQVIVEIYDMGKGIQAYGVLADESDNQIVTTSAGRMEFRNSRGLSFTAGRYYVKIDLYDETVSAVHFADILEEKVGAASDFAPLFERFPTLGTVVGTRYIKEAYRGLGFVKNVLEREYMVDGAGVQVFLVTGEEQEISDLTSAFLNYFSDSEIPYEMIKEKEGTYYKVMDPYEGDWYLLPQKDLLFGIYGAADRALLKAFFAKTGSEGK